MSNRTDEGGLALEKFGIGQPVLRVEDPKLLRGQGRYTDDVNAPGQVYAVMVRSRYAHGTIRMVDVAAARAMPGVVGAYSAADLAAAGVNPIKCGMMVNGRDGKPWLTPVRPLLASGKVRFVGEAVAMVVAETRAQAKDAADAVEVEIDPLPAAASAAEALASGAAQIHDSVPGNVAVDYHWGDSAAVAAAFAKAAHVTKLKLVSNRIVINPLEPRSALGQFDPGTQRYTLQVCSQGVFGMKGGTANVLGTTPDKVRILTDNVGGSFGMKSQVFPENGLVLFAAKALGRPVKWTDERSTSFLSDSHGRAQKIHCELALDAEGKFLAVKVSGYGNLGAYITGVAPQPLSLNIGKNLASVYRTPAMTVDIKTVLTNTTLMGAYRGAGRPEANYFMERLIDRAADEMGINRLTLRKRNFIKPAQIPFSASSGMVYDSGDFQGVFNKAIELSDHANFARRKKESRKRGKLRGIAVGSYLEVTAPPNVELGKIVFEADGSVKLITGTLDYGQGHATPFAQVLSAQLGVPFERIKLEQGDSDLVHTGNGTGGSRSITASGTAIVESSRLVIEKGKRAAAHLMEASEGDIEFANGRFTIAGTDRSIDIMELARRLRDGKMPEGVPSSLDVDHTTEAIPSTFPNGCHVAEVEIDPETGVIQIARYTGVNDFGTVVNPMLVAGQLHGGVAQGIGQAFMENVSYDANGQPITGSFMDYALPRAEDIPLMQIGDHPVPAKSNPLGTKGCGEAGCAGSLATLMNAVLDALSEFGITHLDMPLTPERVWRAIRDAKPKAA